MLCFTKVVKWDFHDITIIHASQQTMTFFPTANKHLFFFEAIMVSTRALPPVSKSGNLRKTARHVDNVVICEAPMLADIFSNSAMWQKLFNYANTLLIV